MNVPNQQQLSAIVLAGGRSSRMGQDKALISMGNQPLLQQVCQTAQHCAEVVYVVTPWTERYQSFLDNTVQLIQEQPLPHEPVHSPHGPLVGFMQALPYVQTEWVLLLACDLPLLNPAILQSWTHHLSQAAPQTLALLPQNSQGWWEALCGFYRRRCLSDLEDFVRQGGRSFQRWLSHHPIEVLPVPNQEMLFNCNTPADLAELKADRSNFLSP